MAKERVLTSEIFRKYPQIIFVSNSLLKKEQMGKMKDGRGVGFSELYEPHGVDLERALEKDWSVFMEANFPNVQGIKTHQVAMEKVMAKIAQLSLPEYFPNQYGRLPDGEYIIIALDSEVAYINPHDQQIVTVGKPDSKQEAVNQYDLLNIKKHVFDSSSIAILKVRFQTGLTPKILNGSLVSIIHEADMHPLEEQVANMMLKNFGSGSKDDPRKYAGGIPSYYGMGLRYNHLHEAIVHAAKETGNPYDIYQLGLNNNSNDELIRLLYKAIFGNHPIHRRLIEQIMEGGPHSIGLHPQAIDVLNSWMPEMQRWVLNTLVGDDQGIVSAAELSRLETVGLKVLPNGQIVKK